MHDCRSTIQVSTAAADPSRAGYDTSWKAGESASSFVFLPQVGTPDYQSRYLVRAVGYRVPAGSRLIEIVQYADLVVVNENEVTYDQGGEGGEVTSYWTSYDYQPIVSPGFQFPNGTGNIAWALTAGGTKVKVNKKLLGPAGTGKSMNLWGQDSALIVQDATTNLPPNGGTPVGTGVGGLGLFRDMRFLEGQPRTPMSVYFDQATLVCLWASVKQPYLASEGIDPFLPTPNPTVDSTSLPPDYHYVRANPDARFGRLGARLTFEIPICGRECCSKCGGGKRKCAA